MKNQSWRMSWSALPLAILLASVVLIVVPGVWMPVEAVGTVIEAAGHECFSETIAAGGTVSLTFRVTDGGGFDVDATLSAETFAAADSIGMVERGYFQEKMQQIRENPIHTELNSWKRVKEGSHMYTAPSAAETNHGLPATVTVCFDNSFSTYSPKWIQFRFLKQDVVEVDPSNNEKVEDEIARTLHEHGRTLFELYAAAERIRELGASDESQVAFADFMTRGEGVFNGSLIVITSVIIHISIVYLVHTRKTRREKPKAGKTDEAAKYRFGGPQNAGANEFGSPFASAAPHTMDANVRDRRRAPKDE